MCIGQGDSEASGLVLISVFLSAVTTVNAIRNTREPSNETILKLMAEDMFVTACGHSKREVCRHNRLNWEETNMHL